MPSSVTTAIEGLLQTFERLGEVVLVGGIFLRLTSSGQAVHNASLMAARQLKTLKIISDIDALKDGSVFPTQFWHADKADMIPSSQLSVGCHKTVRLLSRPDDQYADSYIGLRVGQQQAWCKLNTPSYLLLPFAAGQFNERLDEGGKPVTIFN